MAIVILILGGTLAGLLILFAVVSQAKTSRRVAGNNDGSFVAYTSAGNDCCDAGDAGCDGGGGDGGGGGGD